MSWLKKEWDECSTFFRKDLLIPSFIVGAVFFVIGALVWVYLTFNEEVMIAGYNWLMSIFEQKGIDAETISAMALFKNNAQACLSCILLGMIPFFFIDTLPLITNAASIGIMGPIYLHNNISLLAFVAGLLPHGIFELPAIFISLAIGYKTCLLLTKFICKNGSVAALKEYAFNVLRVYVLLVIPLLIVAALTEAYITPICMQFFL